MSTRKERFAKYTEAMDSYILHQMGKYTEAERQAFRNKQINMYGDKLEKVAEMLKKSVSRLLA